MKTGASRIAHETVKAMPSSAASTALSKRREKTLLDVCRSNTNVRFHAAMGLLNDHYESCASHELTLDRRANFTPPQPC